MKKYLLAVLLLATFQSFGQFLNYTNINGRYKWIAGKFDSTFTLPSGPIPSLRTGGGTGPGALFYRTTDSTIYQYTGTQWIKLRAGVSPTDTAGIWISNVYRKTGTDSVYYVKGGTSTFAFRDSIGNVGGGGGGGKIYYFNGGVSMGTFGGFTMYELGDTAVINTAANFTRSTIGNLANFITDVNRPGLLQIPAGSWTIDAFLSETGGGANHAQIWVKVEKWDGSTITDIATSPIEEITNGNVIDLYTWSVSIPTTTLAVTDRIIIQFYITNTNGKTVTLYTQNGYVGEVHTTFTTGIGSLNGLTAPTQYFATGTSGTDFAISSSTATHTFNLPTASGSNRGALSSADWTTFNGKVSGSGTTNYLPKWTGSSALGNSLIQDDGTNVAIGTTPATYKFRVSGNVFSSSYFVGTTTNTLDQFKAGGLISFASSGTSSYIQIGYDASLNSGWITAVTEGSAYRPIIIGYSSNVGISTIAAPVSRLEIQASQFPAITLRKTGVNIWTIGNRTESTGTNFNISYGTTDILNVTAAGRVLIGTTTESTYELDVVGDIRSTLDANINGLTVGKGLASVATNTAVGVSALGSITTASDVTGVGNSSMRVVTTGSGNTGLGYASGFDMQTGQNNVFIGDFAGRTSTSSQNTFVGSQSGRTTIGGFNTFLGYISGYSVTSGTYNTIIGRSDPGITTGNYNTIIGSQITGLSSSLSNTIILADGQGNQRLYINSTGNVGIGTTSPNASALLDVSSTTKGFLPPRMTGAQAEAIATPAAGLLVYANNGNGTTITTTGWWGYNGSGWVKLN